MRRVNNSLVKIILSLHDSLTKIFDITDLCFVHHFLHAPPYLIIDWIQVWTVRGPQCRIYEVKSFISQKCNCFSSSVRWSTIYLSIYGIYIAPLQGNYSEAIPAQARAKIKVLRRLMLVPFTLSHVFLVDVTFQAVLICYFGFRHSVVP